MIKSKPFTILVTPVPFTETRNILFQWQLSCHASFHHHSSTSRLLHFYVCSMYHHLTKVLHSNPRRDTSLCFDATNSETYFWHAADRRRRPHLLLHFLLPSTTHTCTRLDTFHLPPQPPRHGTTFHATKKKCWEHEKNQKKTLNFEAGISSFTKFSLFLTRSPLRALNYQTFTN